MAIVVSPAFPLNLDYPRKRTSSFSYPSQSSSAFAPNPRPAKAPRLAPSMGLRRTESYITLAEFRPARPTSPPPSRDQSLVLPYYRSLRFYKEQRERHKANANRSLEPITIRIRQEQRPTRPIVRHAPQPCRPSKVTTTPSYKSPAPSPPVAPPTIHTPPRKSSPLAPTRSTLPGRPVFPRSKAEPDLHRKAITTCMKATPEGQKILRMGPRLAVSIMTATKDLEQIVAAQGDREKESQDVIMADAPPILTKSWVVVPGEDWEMVDCSN